MIPPTEDVVSSYSVDITKITEKAVHIGDYSTVEELDKAISDAVKMVNSHKKKRTPFRNNN